MSELGTCRLCQKVLKNGFFALLDDYPYADDNTVCKACGSAEALKAQSDPEEDPEEMERRRLEAELSATADSLARGVLVSTAPEIFRREIIEHLGIARGGTVRAKNAISDFGAGIKNLVGGELVAYTQLMADALEQALHRMKIDAVMLGADAVVSVNFSTSMIDVGTAEISAFGTAVKLDQPQKDE